MRQKTEKAKTEKKNNSDVNANPPPVAPPFDGDYLLPAQARAEIIGFLDSLLLAGADSRGRHNAVNYLRTLKPHKKE